MSMSTRKASRSGLHRVPVAEFHYRQMVPDAMPLEPEDSLEEAVPEPSIEMTEAGFLQRLAQERAAGYAEAEAALKQASQQRSDREAARIATTIANFEQTRKEYFARVESEVVQLALTIAGKILHRESQVDRMLVAALVQIALDQLREGAAATIRLRPEETVRWRTHFAAAGLSVEIRIVDDVDLAPGDCLLETEMGTVNFSLEAQLKELEIGFLDVLAQRPAA